MSISNTLYRYIVTGLFFSIGMLGFMSGEFVISTMLFGAASISGKLNLDSELRF